MEARVCSGSSLLTGRFGRGPGMEVLDEVHRLPTDAPAYLEVVQRQILKDAAPIVSVRRVG